MEGITPGLTESTPNLEPRVVSDMRWALDRIALVAMGVIVVQISTASMWWSAAYGIPILLGDVLLAAGLLIGVFAERMVTRVAHAFRNPRATAAVMTVFGFLAAVAWVLVAAACVKSATTSESRPGGAFSNGCGTPVHPINYDCVPIAGTSSVIYRASVAMIFGGVVMSTLRTGRRVVVSWRAAYVAAIVGALLMVGSLLAVPRSRPSAASQALELAEVTKNVYVGVALLLLGMTVLCTLALIRHNGKFELPVFAALTGLVNASIAGVAIATIWIAVLGDFMKGP